MGYKILIIDTYYQNFLNAFYEKHPQAASLSYDKAISFIMEQCFGTSYYYSANLESLGYLAKDIIANDQMLQGKWAETNGAPIERPSFSRKLLRKVPYVRRFVKQDEWVYSILEAQIKAGRPDVLYFQDLNLCEPEFVVKIKKHVKLIVGQIACPLPEDKYLRGCDLILTSFPHYVGRFRSMGIASEYFKIGFEATLLQKVTKLPPGYGTVFVGGVSKAHGKGTAFLEKIAGQVEMDFWGYGADTLSPDSPIRKRFHGEAWGLDMYSILHNSKIVVNRHIDVAENNANNMRLYETTGVGTFLITDYKDNLGELFEIGKEVESYKSVEECVEKIKFYLTHDSERERIARAGQERTLREHTYEQRMRELDKILKSYLN